MYATHSELRERRGCVPTWIDVHASTRGGDSSDGDSLPRAVHVEYGQGSTVALYTVRVMDEDIRGILKCTCPMSRAHHAETGRAEFLCACVVDESAALPWTRKAPEATLRGEYTVAETLGDLEDEEWGGCWLDM